MTRNDRWHLLVWGFAEILEKHQNRIYVSEMELPLIFGKGIIVGVLRLALPADLDHARRCEIGADLPAAAGRIAGTDIRSEPGQAGNRPGSCGHGIRA